jgi:hypothetical protein
MKRPVSPPPVGTNPNPSADERWAFIQRVIEASGVSPNDVALAALEATMLSPEQEYFEGDLLMLVSAAQQIALARRAASCDCPACAPTAAKAEPELVYGNDGVVRYAGIPVVRLQQGDES